MDDAWLTLEEAAAYLKVSKPTLYRLTSSGQLQFYKLGGTGARRFKRADLDAQLIPGQPGETLDETVDDSHGRVLPPTP